MTATTSRAPSGFTLTELLIALAVIGILAMVALPSYQDTLRRSRRADARLLLVDTAQRLERCYAECNDYTALGCATPCPTLPLGSLQGYYEISAANGSVIDAEEFTLVATPVSGRAQAQDRACTALSLDHRETMSATGTDAAHCWN